MTPILNKTVPFEPLFYYNLINILKQYFCFFFAISDSDIDYDDTNSHPTSQPLVKKVYDKNVSFAISSSSSKPKITKSKSAVVFREGRMNSFFFFKYKLFVI